MWNSKTDYRSRHSIYTLGVDVTIESAQDPPLRVSFEPSEVFIGRKSLLAGVAVGVGKLMQTRLDVI